jgi:hypothetical protein
MNEHTTPYFERIFSLIGSNAPVFAEEDLVILRDKTFPKLHPYEVPFAAYAALEERFKHVAVTSEYGCFFVQCLGGPLTSGNTLNDAITAAFIRSLALPENCFILDPETQPFPAWKDFQLIETWGEFVDIARKFKYLTFTAFKDMVVLVFHTGVSIKSKHLVCSVYGGLFVDDLTNTGDINPLMTGNLVIPRIMAFARKRAAEPAGIAVHSVRTETNVILPHKIELLGASGSKDIVDSWIMKHVFAEKVPLCEKMSQMIGVINNRLVMLLQGQKFDIEATVRERRLVEIKEPQEETSGQARSRQQQRGTGALRQA